MMMIKKQIPNVITLLSIFFGCIAILMAVDRHFEAAFYFVLLSGLLDFLDGLAARLLHALSSIAPAFIMFVYILDHLPVSMNSVQNYLAASAFIIPMFSAYRLARFNVQQSDANYFSGLPTPANAFFYISLPFLFDYFHLNSVFIIPLIILMSMLMVSNIPMFSFKVKTLCFHENWLMYLFLFSVSMMLLFLPVLVIPSLAVLLYIILSFLFFKPNKRSCCGANE